MLGSRLQPGGAWLYYSLGHLGRKELASLPGGSTDALALPAPKPPLISDPLSLVQAVLRSAYGSRCSSRRGSQRNSPAASQPSSPLVCLPGPGAPAGALFALQPPAPKPCSGSAAARVLLRLRRWCAVALPGAARHPRVLPADDLRRLREVLAAAVASKAFRWQGILVTLFNCGVLAVRNPGNSDTLGARRRPPECAGVLPCRWLTATALPPLHRSWVARAAGPPLPGLLPRRAGGQPARRAALCTAARTAGGCSQSRGRMQAGQARRLPT